jgi:hypothetical protein
MREQSSVFASGFLRRHTVIARDYFLLEQVDCAVFSPVIVSVVRPMAVLLACPVVIAHAATTGGCATPAWVLERPLEDSATSEGVLCNTAHWEKFRQEHGVDILSLAWRPLPLLPSRSITAE